MNTSYAEFRFGAPAVFHKHSNPQEEIRLEFIFWETSSFGAPTEFRLMEHSASGTLFGVPLTGMVSFLTIPS